MHRIAMLIAMLASLLVTSVPAHAHAMLDHASPPVGSSVRTAPHEVVLWFSQNLEAAFSRIEVRNASGARVDGGKAQVNRGNRTQIRVPLRSLPPGLYNVHWRVLSVDTHTTEGNFSFRVGE